MAKIVSRRLVIDASVARAAGPEGAMHPTAKNCRDFLNAVLEICHRVVMAPEITDEWRKHQSGFARKWRVRMMARKKVDHLETPPIDATLRKFDRFQCSDREREGIAKDLPLITAALATDRTIAALDDTARALFAKASVVVAELKTLVWVNPDRPQGDAINWLQGGAKPETKRMLGAYA